MSSLDPERTSTEVPGDSAVGENAAESSPARIEPRRIGAIREEPYFASPVFACPSCGYLATVGLPECPRCFASLPQPASRMRLAVRGLQWGVVIGGFGLLVGMPWWALTIAWTIAVGWELARQRLPRHPAQFGGD